MIKVLQLVGGGVAIGGVEKMLLNYYAYMDRSKIHFDFCFYRRSTLVASHIEFAEYIKDSKIYDLRLFEGAGKLLGYVKAIPKVKKLIRENQYDVVHINAGRPPLLFSGLIAATLAGAKVKITHSHSTKGKSGRSRIADIAYAIGFAIVRPIFRSMSTRLAACSTEAGKYMYGDNVVNSPKYMPIHNAIILESFIYSEDVRKSVRKELGIKGNTVVYGNIGRFSLQKNHFFLIEVFAAIKKKQSDSVLWLVGDGELKPDIEKRIKELQLEDSILLLGERNDPHRLYQGMDALLFPSLWEGLSVTAVEAQASSLPVFASTNISPEHQLTDRIYFIDLSKGGAFWADYILRKMAEAPNRMNMSEQITRSGYNIEEEAQSLQESYIRLVKK